MLSGSFITGREEKVISEGVPEPEAPGPLPGNGRPQDAPLLGRAGGSFVYDTTQDAEIPSQMCSRSTPAQAEKHR